jgi:ribonuclease J
MLRLTWPRFFVPIHGEHRHLFWHAELARQMGMPADRVMLLEDGDVLELTAEHGRVSGRVPAGRVLVDGKGVGDVGDAVLRDRQHLAQDGMVVVVVGLDKTGTIVVGPELISRGFADLPEEDALLEGARTLIVTTLDACDPVEKTDWVLVKQRIRSVLRKYLHKAVERRPMILPVVIEV